MRRASRQDGFTLIELLVVVSILALLVGILVPSLRGARTSAKRVVCATNLRSIGQALRLYLDNNKELLPIVEGLPSMPPDFRPPRPSLAETLRPYLEDSPATKQQDRDVFHCPADRPGFSDRGEPNANKSFFETEGSSYEFNTQLYFLMVEDFEAGPEHWVIQPKTLYQLVRNERMIAFYNGQPAEEQIWLIKDYLAFHEVKGGNQPFNFLYVDGHVADLER